MSLRIIYTVFFLFIFLSVTLSQTKKLSQPQKPKVQKATSISTSLSDSINKEIANYKGINDSLKFVLKEQRKGNNSLTQILNDSLQEKTNQIHSLKKVLNNQAQTKKTFYITIAILLLLFFILVLLFFKIYKMNKEKSEVLKFATQNVDELYDLLIKKGVINLSDRKLGDIVIQKKLDLIKDKIRNLVEKYLNEDENNKIKNEEIQNLRDELKKVMILNNDLQKKITNFKEEDMVITQTLNKFTQIEYFPKYENVYIKSQTLVSAGPRKESTNSDTELGEDVAGTLSLPGQTFFWLLDGTSDSAALKAESKNSSNELYQESHIFSSRLLAQNFGNYIQKNIENLFDNKIGLEQLLEQARTEIIKDWEKIINNNISIEKKTSISNLIQQGFKPLCSTTIIVGRFLVDGSLYVLRTGDSKLFPFKEASDNTLKLVKDFKFVTDPTEENDRIAFRLDYDTTLESFKIKSNVPKWVTQTAKEISTVFVFSDGIGRTIESYLSSDNPGIIEEIKQRISRIPQKTYDDKSLILLERLNISTKQQYES